MKVYYDCKSKRFITFNQVLDDSFNHLARHEKRKYDVLVLDDTSSFYQEYLKEQEKQKSKEEKEYEQLSLI